MLLAAAVICAGSGGATSVSLPPDWVPVSVGPNGGTVYQGWIPNSVMPADDRPSAIYLPPGFNPARRYLVVYLLHGMPGAPSSFWDGLRLATVADGLITSGKAQPFIAVIPVAGPTVRRSNGEWAGFWEDYIVYDVVPWVDSHLPTQAGPGGRALEGLSAGGFGAVDIGLRHPGLFQTLGSWAGYFAPLFRDGPFLRVSAADLRAHNPALLVRQQARQLRQSRVRFYVSVGYNHGRLIRQSSLEFAHELATLRLQHELWVLSPGQGHFWAATLPSALRYAAPPIAEHRPTTR